MSRTPRTPRITVARTARGRERVLTDASPLPLVVQVCLDVIARHRAAEEPLDRVVAAVGRERHLGGRERRAVADLAFAWSRHKLAVEAIVDDAVRRARGMAPGRRHKDLAGVLLAVIAGGADVDVDDAVIAAVPDGIREAVVDARDNGLTLRATLPRWLEMALDRSWGTESAAVRAALGKSAQPVVAVDVRAVSLDDVVAALAALSVRVERSPLSPTALVVVEGRLRLPQLPPPLRRAVWPMDDGSQAVAHAVGALPGERVLDLCAGGGGKARLLTHTGATVVAVDKDAGRLLRSTPKGAQAVVADGTAAPFAPRSFDRVLVDAPCSGTGTLRRAPDLAMRLQPDDVPPLVATQTALLTSALSLVKRGGVVVYATCSLLKDENSDVVDAVVAAGAGVRAAADRHLLPPASDGFFIATLHAPAGAR